MQVGDFIRNQCSTVGIGHLVLTLPDGEDVISFRDKWQVSTEVAYVIVDGINRETGIGTFNGVSTIVRDTIINTLVNGSYDETNPDPLYLGGAAIVACAPTAGMTNQMLSDLSGVLAQVDINTGNIATNTGNIATNTGNIATNTADIAANAEDIAGLTDDLIVLDTDVSFRESAITALESGGSVVGNGPTAVLVHAGNGEIIDSYSDTEDQDTKDVNWPETSFDLLTNAGMPALTGLGYTEIGIIRPEVGDGLGMVSAYPNGISDAQRRMVIRLAAVEYLDQVITAITFVPVVSNQIGNVLMDLIAFTELSERIKGMILRPTSIGDLSVWRDSGMVFAVGINYETALDNQNVKDTPAEGATDDEIPFGTLVYNNGDTNTLAPITIVPDNEYEPDGLGVLEAVSNGATTIHYMVQSAGGSFYLSYGQREYATHDEAKANMFSDRTSHLFPVEVSNFLLLAQLVIDKGATDWGPDAEIYQMGSTTASGSEGGSSNQAINISYTDTYNLGPNVQVALDSLASVKMSASQADAMDAANAPTGANPLATIEDINTDGVVTTIVAGNDISVDSTDPNNPIVSSTVVPVDITGKMDKAANLSDVANISTSRDNLDVYSMEEVDDVQDIRMAKSANLGDVANVEASRTNLGVYSKATADDKYSTDPAVSQGRKHRIIQEELDLDLLIEGGRYMGTALVNAPEDLQEWFFVEIQRHNDLYIIQTATPFTSADVSRSWKRVMSNGVWQAWVKQIAPDAKNTFTKPQAISAFNAVSSTGDVVLDMTNYTTFHVDSPGAVNFTTPILPAQGVLSGIIRLESAVTAVTFNTAWTFGDGALPPGGEVGYIMYTNWGAGLVIASYVRQA